MPRTPLLPARYLLDRELARGGLGRIWIAEDRLLGRAVAVKQLMDRSPGARARFRREARITARLEHPAIVPIQDAGEDANGEVYYVMKRVSGDSLKAAIAERPSLEARLALVPNLLAVADAIAYAHSQRIVHRDIKPSNVAVGAFGETVVLDWGLAKELAAPDDAGEPEVVGGRAAVVGTPAYMAPEQARGERIDVRTDVYALGASLYHVLTGAPPYRGRSAESILAQVLAGEPAPLRFVEPDVPPGLAAIVAKAMARDPEQRYAEAAGFRDDLRRFLEGELVRAHRYSPAQLAKRWLRRHRAVAVAVAIVAAFAVGERIAARQGHTVAFAPAAAKALSVGAGRDAGAAAPDRPAPVVFHGPGTRCTEVESGGAR